VNLEPVNILLVDDQPAKLLSYEVILEGLGERLIKAASAREALAHLLKQDVGVVLIDVNMPELDGFELAAMIREHPRFQQTALIFVSAIHLSDFDRLRGYEAGAVDYVPVPVVPEVLKAKVRVFAELHRKTRELERLNAELELRVEERTAALEASTRELQQLNNELEARIEQRTREREQALAQLFEAQKLDTIGQLTGGVAHDFNNLLMAVMGSLQILRKRLPDDRTCQRLLDNAVQGAERGAALTQRLLAFARRQELRPEVISVDALVNGMTEMLTRTLGPTIAVKLDLAPQLPPVSIDANQLELALLNLAINARDAMPQGGVLQIAACEEVLGSEGDIPRLAPGSYVRLTVTDDGDGMDEETLARAVEPFFTTKGVGKGTGLGLSMVQGLAAQSGGALRISSRPGEGCLIDVWLPRSTEVAVTTVVEAKPQSGGGVKPVTILLVDDDPLVCTGTAAMLEDLGHRVVEALSGEIALTLLERNPQIDLVITDHAMPGLTGLGLYSRLRASHPHIPVVLASGYADLPTREAAPAEMIRLSKPFLQEDVARAIGEALGTCQSARKVEETLS
jgi:signal transduction histidine kinase